MNNISGLMSSQPEEDGSSRETLENGEELSASGRSVAETRPPQSSSFLGQVGSLFGSGWSRLGLNRGGKSQPRGEKDGRNHEQVPAVANTEVGLAGLL